MYEPKKQHKKNKPDWWYVAIVILVLLIGVVFGRIWNDMFADKISSKHPTTNQPDNKPTALKQTDTQTTKTDEQTVLTVELIKPSRENLDVNIKAEGTVKAKRTASVSSKINGMAIQDVLVQEGDWVQAGQLMARLDISQLQQNMLQAQARVVEASASLENAQANAARVTPLLNINAVSQLEVDRYTTAVKQARAALMSAKAQLNTQTINLNNSQVLAPVSGIVSHKQAEVGSIPQGALFNIIEQGVLEWQAKLSADMIKFIRVGNPVIVKVPNQKWITGKISRIAPMASNDRKISVYATLESNSSVQAGMYLSGEFVIGASPQLAVPTSAVVSSDGYDYLMLATNIKKTTGKDPITTARIKRLKVNLGKQFDNFVAIDTTLPANSAIVRQGGSFLTDGDLVRVVTPKIESTFANHPNAEYANDYAYANNNSVMSLSHDSIDNAMHGAKNGMDEHSIAERQAQASSQVTDTTNIQNNQSNQATPQPTNSQNNDLDDSLDDNLNDDLNDNLDLSDKVNSDTLSNDNLAFAEPKQTDNPNIANPDLADTLSSTAQQPISNDQLSNSHNTNNSAVGE